MKKSELKRIIREEIEGLKESNHASFIEVNKAIGNLKNAITYFDGDNAENSAQMIEREYEFLGDAIRKYLEGKTMGSYRSYNP